MSAQQDAWNSENVSVVGSAKKDPPFSEMTPSPVRGTALKPIHSPIYSEFNVFDKIMWFFIGYIAFLPSIIMMMMIFCFNALIKAVLSLLSGLVS